MEDPGSLPEEILKTPQVIILTLVIIVKSMCVFERIVTCNTNNTPMKAI
jgi:hypothetical protein